jgi:hypothetical protein
MSAPSTFVPLRQSVMGRAAMRLMIFDCSALSCDVIAATHRGKPSSFVAGMRDGTIRGFITHSVWAEVPRVLEDRAREGEDFDLAGAERLWWSVYVPVLYTVCTVGLPFTPEARRLLAEDPSDEGMLRLHAVLGPAALIAADRDLIRGGIAHPDWPRVRAAVGHVGRAEGQAGVAARLVVIFVEGTVRGLVAAARGARARPLTGLMLAAALLLGGLLYGRSHPGTAIGRIRSFLNEIGRAAGEQASVVCEQYERGEAVWVDAERGTITDSTLSKVTRVLASAPEPMTRSAILTAVGTFPGRTHRDRMFGLYELLCTYPGFCEIAAHHWQLGRTDVGHRLT